MNKDAIKIGLLAIAGGIFAVHICNAQPYVLLAPIMSIIVGHSAQTLGGHKKNVNRMIVLIILTFLVVLPYLESHPKAISRIKVNLYRQFSDLPNTSDRIKISPELKTSRPELGKGNISRISNSSQSN